MPSTLRPIGLVWSSAAARGILTRPQNRRVPMCGDMLKYARISTLSLDGLEMACPAGDATEVTDAFTNAQRFAAVRPTLIAAFVAVA
eukprot:5828944-Prymnesium_polylepis.1